MEGKNTIMKVKSSMDTKLSEYKRLTKKCTFDLLNGHSHYAFYDMDYYPFRATQTSDLYF